MNRTEDKSTEDGAAFVTEMLLRLFPAKSFHGVTSTLDASTVFVQLALSTSFSWRFNVCEWCTPVPKCRDTCERVGKFETRLENY